MNPLRIFAAVLACGFGAAQAQTYRADDHTFRVVKLVLGLQQPWSLAFLPDGRMLVTEKAGRLRIVSNGKLDPQPIAGLPEVTVHGQGDCMTWFCIRIFQRTDWCTSPTPPAAT